MIWGIGARLWWGLAVLAVLLWLTGMLVVGSVPGLPSPPAFIAWALPGARYARDVAGAIAIGAVVVGALLGPSDRVRGWAIRWVAMWLGCTLLLLGLTMIDVFAVLPAGPMDAVINFLFANLIGPVFVAQIIALVTLIAVLPSSGRRGIGWLATVLALVAFMLPSLLGHGGLSGEHISLVVSLAVHLGAVALWVGGLAVVVAVLRIEPERAQALLPRFSLLALWCVIIAAESGLLNASLRLGAPGEFVGTLYGSVVLMKIALLAWLIQFGWLQRNTAVAQAVRGAPVRLTRLAATEALLMAAAIACAVLLSRLGPGSLGPQNVPFAPLTVASLGLVIPMVLSVWLPLPSAMARLREYPEVPGVLLLIVVALTSMGVMTRALGMQLGAVIGALALIGCGWLAFGAIAGPRRRLGMLICAIGWPVVAVFAAVVSGQVDWALLTMSLVVVEAVLWLSARRSTAHSDEEDVVAAVV